MLMVAQLGAKTWRSVNVQAHRRSLKMLPIEKHSPSGKSHVGIHQSGRGSKLVFITL